MTFLRGRGDLFSVLESAAESFPFRAALETPSAIFSYRDLCERALGCASTLVQHCPPDVEIVGILGGKSEHVMFGLWGALASGRAYLILSPKFPAGRIRKMLTTAACRAVIICPDAVDSASELLREGSAEEYFVFNESDLKKLRERFPDNRFWLLGKRSPSDFKRSAPHRLAYVCFTSGSTGAPKGVMIRQESVEQYISNVTGLWAFEPGLRFSVMHELTFDITVHDLYICWATGGTLCIPQEKYMMAPHRFICEQRINCWISVPSMATIMSRLKALKAGALPSLKYSFFCGEALYETQVREWKSAASNSKIINLYGPTEATCAITYYDCTQDRELKTHNGIVCVGRVFGNQDSTLLPMKDLPPGSGELCLGGSQVAIGYINDAVRTEEKFVEIEGGPGQRYYRTGDHFRLDTDGELFFLGRMDQQVKVKGYRVELPEIDFALKSVLGTDQIATVAYEIPGSGSKELVSFVGTFAGLDPKRVQELLEATLPSYMVPSKLILMESFPMNSSGKIDRLALKAIAEKG